MKTTVEVPENAAPMSLSFDDADPVARCHVMTQQKDLHGKAENGFHVCRWRSHGDSVNDAVLAWAKHLTHRHAREWE